MISRALMVVAVAFAGGCATVPKPAQPGLLDDRLFGPASASVAADDIFALSPPMKEFVATTIAQDVRNKGPQQALFDSLYGAGMLKLAYDSEVTRNATETFTARAGNCLSLVIMTAAFAKAMGLTVTYQRAVDEEAWSRSGNLYVAVGHVNLVLGSRRSQLGAYLPEADKFTIDFQPPRDIRGLRTKVVSEDTIVAMYFNNRAVESLAGGRIDDAYRFVRAAIARDGDFLSAYNTLGAVYQRHGNLAHAESAFRYALERDPRNTLAMSNLVSVMVDLGRTSEAEALRTALRRLEPNPPFAYFNLGLEAMQRGACSVARDWFARETERMPYYPEFQFWLAAAYACLGQYVPAREHMALAIESSGTERDRQLYSRKLELLRGRQ